MRGNFKFKVGDGVLLRNTHNLGHIGKAILARWHMKYGEIEAIFYNVKTLRYRVRFWDTDTQRWNYIRVNPSNLELVYKAEPGLMNPVNPDNKMWELKWTVEITDSDEFLEAFIDMLHEHGWTGGGIMFPTDEED